MSLTPDESQRIRAQAEAEYPAECCGVVVVRDGAPSDRCVIPCRNAQDELHGRDRTRYPRDARTAYTIASEDLLKIGILERDGYRVEVIYHSHVDAGAYFSETDKNSALVLGEPLYPNATYVVVSVVAGKAVAAAAFAWHAGRRDFLPVELQGV